MSMVDDELSEVLSIRVSAADRILLEKVGALLPMLKPMAIARAALRLGLEELEREPALVVTSPVLLKKGSGAKGRAGKGTGRMR